MNIGVVCSAVSLLYVLLILIVFLSKERVNTFETRIYFVQLITTIIGITIELVCTYFCLATGANEFVFLKEILLKAIVLYFGVWTLEFYLYVRNIGIDYSTQELKTANSVKRHETNKKIIIGFVIASLVAVILPIYTSVENGRITNSYGPMCNFMYIISGIIILLCVVSMIINIRKKFDKRFIPLFIFLTFGTIIVCIQYANPRLLLMSAMESFIIVLMYFTIENPDAKMIQQLEVAREQADKANRAKTEFLSSMSHEIRTPLNAIVGFSSEILEAKDLEEAQSNANDIVHASETLLEIVNGILDISKIEAGKVEIVNSPYDAHEVFEELAKLITPKMKEKGLDFTYNIAEDLPNTLFGDHANVKKIVTNLLSNACKYTEKGYVRYEVNCINTDNVCKLIISVEDSGRGIKKENVDQLFTQFQRLEEDRNTTIEGTGLGLAITKQLIELMGGRIILHTVYGEGSKFTVVLNQRITKAQVREKKKSSTTLDLKGVSILLVDDTPLNLKVATKLLQRYGADKIDTCNSGFECLDKIKAGEKYDLVMLDDMMPKMSGVETLHQLKELTMYKSPTIALTANAITGMREKYLADGFDDYLAKPIDKGQLIQVVNQVLGRSYTEEIDVAKIEEAQQEEKEEKPVSEEPASETKEEKTEAKEEEKSEEEAKSDIIPVEENIEEELGTQLDRNYQGEDKSEEDSEAEENKSEEEPIEKEEKQEERNTFNFVKSEEVPESTEEEHHEESSEVEEKEENDSENKDIDISKIQTIPVVDINMPKKTEEVSTVAAVKPIEEVKPVEPVEDESSDSESSGGTYDRSYLESKGVDVDHALELLGDMEMYNETMKDFVGEVENKWADIVKYKEEDNMPDYAILVHSLKSDCKYLGFMTLADVAYQHELKSKENDSAFVNENFAELEDNYKKVLEIVKEYSSHIN